MALPKCFDILNLDYFTNIQAEIGTCATVAELQNIVDKVFADISLLESTIQSQIDSLTKVSALLVVPGANLSDIITWITGFINDFLTPLIKPLATSIAQLAALATQVTALIASIEAAALRLGVTITIPTITISCEL